MDEHYVTQIVLQQYRSFSSYSERETAAASHVSIGAIRHLRALGLIEGVETGGGLRYSEEEGIRLRRGPPGGNDPGGEPAGGGRVGHVFPGHQDPPTKILGGRKKGTPGGGGRPRLGEGGG